MGTLVGTYGNLQMITLAVNPLLPPRLFLTVGETLPHHHLSSLQNYMFHESLSLLGRITVPETQPATSPHPHTQLQTLQRKGS